MARQFRCMGIADCKTAPLLKATRPLAFSICQPRAIASSSWVGIAGGCSCSVLDENSENFGPDGSLHAGNFFFSKLEK